MGYGDMLWSLWECGQGAKRMHTFSAALLSAQSGTICQKTLFHAISQLERGGLCPSFESAHRNNILDLLRRYVVLEQMDEFLDWNQLLDMLHNTITNAQHMLIKQRLNSKNTSRNRQLTVIAETGMIQ